jgi:hypothetical protein
MYQRKKINFSNYQDVRTSDRTSVHHTPTCIQFIKPILAIFI